MYPIGTFSKLVDVSVKTLRYYHEIDLFSPSYIEPKTNYRYYSFNKFSEIEKIKLFKSFGLSLDEIKVLITTDFSTMNTLLVEQQKTLNDEKRKIENQLSLIEEMLKTDKKKIHTSFTISNVKFEERDITTVLSVREEIDLNNINLLVKKLFEKAYAYNIELVGNLMVSLTIGSPLSDVEVMMEISNESLLKEKTVDVKLIEGGQYASLYFKGLYSDLHYAYEKLSEYAINDNYVFIEEYVEGLVPKDLDKPLLVRPNIEKHPETFVTKLLLKL